VDFGPIALLVVLVLAIGGAVYLVASAVGAERGERVVERGPTLTGASR
jgi:hypothetical protein